MRKHVHTVLCWLLAASIVWLPFSVSADFSLFSIVSEHCHEMTTVMPGQTANAHSMDMPMQQDDDCDHCCDGCMDCASMSNCSHGTNHTSAFIKIDSKLLSPIQPSQSVFEYRAQYPSLITSPDIRPPII